MQHILTLTTYDVYNYGASLQAYALQQYLITQGYKSELINYQPAYLRRRYDYKWVNPESALSKFWITRIAYRILKYIQRQTTMGRKKAFDKFHEQLLNQTEPFYTYEELADNPPIGDLYIVGSDQIWNTFYETGRDGAFYLDFVKQGVKASYSASFSYTKISKEWKEQITIWLKDFKQIAVREYHGVDILRSMGYEGIWVLDPVFLLPIKKWKEIMVPIKNIEPYILVYDFEKNKEIERFCKEYAKKMGLKIYSINDTYPKMYANKNFSSAGPADFLTLIYNCSAFVSNSFHGTAFSIMFNKPVFVFNRKRHKVNSRMESLTKMFGIEDCIVPEGFCIDKYTEMDFDFNHINNIYAKELKKSTDYLNLIL